jgi:hypothetical protein
MKHDKTLLKREINLWFINEKPYKRKTNLWFISKKPCSKGKPIYGLLIKTLVKRENQSMVFFFFISPYIKNSQKRPWVAASVASAILIRALKLLG